MLGQPWRSPSAEEVASLTKLARLAFEAGDRPDARWLVPSGLNIARAARETSAPIFASYRERLSKILEHYALAIFELDAEAIIARTETAIAKRLGKLSGSYRADMKLLKALRTDKTLPPTILDDLREVFEIQKLGKAIDDSAGRLKPAFGSWFDGRDTDVDGIARACEVAGEVIDLSAADSDLGVLATRVSHASQPDVAVAQKSAQVDASLRDVLGGFDLLTKLSARHADTAPEAQQLDTLRTDLELMVEPTAELARVVRRLRDGRAAGGSSLEDINRDAALVAETHRDVALVDQERSKWQRAIGEHYVGAGTNWDALEAATAWLASFFELFPDEPTNPLLQLTAPTPARPAGFRQLAERAGARRALWTP